MRDEESFLDEIGGWGGKILFRQFTVIKTIFDYQELFKEVSNTTSQFH